MTDTPSTLRISAGPRVRLVGRQAIDAAAIQEFLASEGRAWETDTEVGAERLAEMAGRLCYLSYGQGRKTNREFIGHLINVGHGSVLEHAVWNFVVTGVSRSFTHELVRHRAGWAYSQLSQRYVDESMAEFIEPPAIAAHPELHARWVASVDMARETYRYLVGGLEAVYRNEPDATLRRKLARQAARSVLPNATETKIFVSANARALRHFIEMRASEAADIEMRRVAVMFLRIMQVESPSMFGDYTIRMLADGSECAYTERPKV